MYYWIALNVAPALSSVIALVINSRGDYYCGGNGAVFRSFDKGTTWESSSIGLTSNLVFSLAVNANGHLFAGSIDGIFRSVNNGGTWNLIYPNAYPLSIVTNTNGHIFVGNGGSVSRSIDNGDHWVSVSLNAPLDVTSLAINSKGYILAGTTHNSTGTGHIFRSTDNGDHWTPLKASQADPFVYSLVINSSGHIFAGTDNAIFRSTDNGDTWTPLITGLAKVNTLLVNSSGHLFAGTLGVLRSTDNGNNWTAINDGLGDSDVRSLAIDSSGYLICTIGRAIFRSVQSTTSIKIISNESHTSFSLEQNYPNPFNPATTISFSLPQAAYMTLKIYNILGEEVATVLAEFRPAGMHKISWNPNNLPSGVYLYRLQTDENILTKKLLFVK